jgi:putative sigma-54 modulation protein
MPLSDAIREYAEAKVGKLDHYFDGVTSCRVVLSVQNNRHVAEVEVHVVKHGVIVSVAESDNLYRSLDLVMNKLPRQLKKYKEKLRDKSHDEGRARRRSD